MQPVSLCFQPERLQIVQDATGCEKNQATVALYELEQHDWKHFKRKPGEPSIGSLSPKPSVRMLAAQQQLKATMLNEGITPELAVHCVREFFLELSRLYGSKDLYVAHPERMQQLLSTL